MARIRTDFIQVWYVFLVERAILEPVGMVNASKNKDRMIDAATIANPNALVHSQVIVFLLALFTIFSLSNDDLVRINFPYLLDGNTEKSIYLPIYLLTSLAMFVGVIIGVLIEYLRNMRFRKAFNEKNKRLLKIEEELQKSKEKFLTEEEKIFNLLD